MVPDKVVGHSSGVGGWRSSRLGWSLATLFLGHQFEMGNICEIEARNYFGDSIAHAMRDCLFSVCSTQPTASILQ